MVDCIVSYRIDVGACIGKCITLFGAIVGEIGLNVTVPLGLNVACDRFVIDCRRIGLEPQLLVTEW